jgi:hypothetical protein
VFNQKLYHGNAGDHNGWKYEINVIFNGFSVDCIDLTATRFQDDIDVYFTGMDGTIHQVFASPHTGWNYHYKSISNGQCLTNDSFQLVRCGNHVDLYFIGKDNKIYHTYNGEKNQWNWDEPKKLTD